MGNNTRWQVRKLKDAWEGVPRKSRKIMSSVGFNNSID